MTTMISAMIGVIGGFVLSMAIGVGKEATMFGTGTIVGATMIFVVYLISKKRKES